MSFPEEPLNIRMMKYPLFERRVVPRDRTPPRKIECLGCKLDQEKKLRKYELARWLDDGGR